MFEKVEKCPVCESTDFSNYKIIKDHAISGESFALSKCAKCSFIFTNPRPSIPFIGKYYEHPNYISHTNKSKNITDILYKTIRKYTLNKKVKLINSLSEKGKILDIGCGNGHFLNECANNNWQVFGMESNETARNNATELIQKNIYNSIEQVCETKKYNIITLWHVLEHIHELDVYLKTIKKCLKKGGKIIIAVPNVESYDAKYFDEFWAAYDVPRHLYHFSSKTIKKLLKNHKLHVNQILPMPFDAYYVSLLSIKYKEKSNNFLKAYTIGAKSNKLAKENNNNFSSLIYIVNK